MRIYLACTVRGDRSALEAARRIQRRLVDLGHEVLTAHLLADDVEAVERQLSEAEVYARDLRWLESCDALVAEASGSSYGVGFEVGYILGRAAHTGQRAYVFYHQARRHAVSRLVSGLDHTNGLVHPYASLDEIDEAIDRYFARH
jgi:nucleoside 2-deoxyribosyltransferase